MAKDKKKKGKAGKTVAGVGILAIIAAILGFDPFGLGIGLGAGTGTGTGTGDGTTRQEQNDDYLMNDDQMPTVIPPATATPAVEEQKDESTTIVELVELAVKVSKSVVVYNGTEGTAQSVADSLASEYAENTANILVKVTLEDAVYDTVEELKTALEGKGIKYEIAE